MKGDSRGIVFLLGYILVCAVLSLLWGCTSPTAPSRDKVQPTPEFTR